MELFQLEQLIKQYKSNKEQEAQILAIVKNQNKEIKDEFISRDLEQLEVDGIKCSVTKTVKEGFNEEKALELVKNILDPSKLKNLIKTKEYLDMDELDNLIYKGDLNAAELAPCVIKNPPVYTLRIK